MPAAATLVLEAELRDIKEVVVVSIVFQGWDGLVHSRQVMSWSAHPRIGTCADGGFAATGELKADPDNRAWVVEEERTTVVSITSVPSVLVSLAV